MTLLGDTLKFSPIKLEANSNAYLAFPAAEAKPVLFRLATYDTLSKSKDELAVRLSNEAMVAQLNRSLYTNKQAELDQANRQSTVRTAIIIISGVGASVATFFLGYLIAGLK